ncbi:zinc ABC transporter permease AztB [Mycobacterium deserti]|uniref:Zinc ABC transporter permease AztB n=1 Tax=Mycobacterium deserti TaxID=2978347 RepID=A0ABT2M8H8_9MYCO|nr:zinc ABC transporter permease AztB [Mycobacterium deserti]MCT7657909.1 zinc ABC transporter permease AztB [Mycobacterium deserti]
MLRWLLDPFHSDVVQRALIAGAIVAFLCAIVGTWVVLRGSAFLGDAMSHGVLPGVAVASLLGGNIFVGAMIAALAMAYGVSTVSGASRLSADTSIGLLLVGMLATGVIIVSHSQSYAVDLTGFLFGDVLAVRTSDIAFLTVALLLTTAVAIVGRRAFVAATFDTRKATTLGLRPTLAAAVLTVLVAVAIVASFRVVGTLLVFGLLIAPPAAAAIWANAIPRIMAVAAVIGVAAVGLGLVVSWYAGTAGGATIAATAVGIFFISFGAAALRRHVAKAGALLMAAVFVAGCGGGGEETAATTAPAVDDHEAPPAGAQESAEPVTRLVLVNPATGDTSVFDVLDEAETTVGRFGSVEKLSGDGRFGYLHGHDELTIVDAGSWTFDHGDHNHYYVTDPALAGTVGVAAATVTADQKVAVVRTGEGGVRLLNRDRLAEHETDPATADLGARRDAAQAAPRRDGVLIVTETGKLELVDDAGGVRPLPGNCPRATAPIVLSRSVIFGCANGALRVAVSGQEPTVTPVPFPAGGPAVALGPLQNRARHDVLAALAGDDIWVLDSGRRTWSTVPARGAVAVSTGDDGEVLVLTRDGVLHAVDTTSGAETSSVRVFSDGLPAEGPPPVIEVDSERAYVNNAAANQIYEIDYGDRMRIARILETDVEPGLMVKAGR